MFSAFKKFGKLGALASSVARAWSPLALWPNGASSPGLWISPRTLTSEWQDYTGTTPVATPGTVADSSNPVGLALDIRAGATVLTDPGNHMLQSTSVNRPLLSARKNLLVGTDTLSTQSVTVIASQCVLSFTGTGTVTLSGVSTAGPLVGTGASDRVSLTFTPTAGSLTLTVSGSVTLAQLEYVA